MGLGDLIADADWATATISGVVGLVSVVVTNWLAWARFRRTHRLEDRSEEVLRGMFKGGFANRGWKRRKFSTLRHFVPLSDEKLREALLRAGAIRLDDEPVEQWGLLKHHRARVFSRKNGKPVT